MSHHDDMIEAVNAAALRVGETTLGITKAFITDVYAELRTRRIISCSLEVFKRWLAWCHAAGGVCLSRCDMPELHDHGRVDASEINAMWHFIRVER